MSSRFEILVRRQMLKKSINRRPKCSIHAKIYFEKDAHVGDRKLRVLRTIGKLKIEQF